MRVLIKEKLSPNKYKTPEGYLVCVDAILARTGKQQYRKNELYVDSDDDSIVDVDRPYDEVFSEQTIASFENKPFVNEHPNEDVNVHNHKDYAVGFVRDVHKGEVDGEPVLLGNLIITDEETIAEIESGEKTELSCGYDCDITDDENPCQRNIRGNHVALCKAGRAGIARIQDSQVEDSIKDNDSEILKFLKSYKSDLENLFLSKMPASKIMQAIYDKYDGDFMDDYDSMKSLWKKISNVKWRDSIPYSVEVEDSINDAPTGYEIKTQNRKINMYGPRHNADLKSFQENVKSYISSKDEKDKEKFKRNILQNYERLSEDFNVDMKAAKNNEIEATTNEILSHYNREVNLYLNKIKELRLKTLDSIKDVRNLSISGWEYKDNDFNNELNEVKELFNSNNIKDGGNKLNKLLCVARDCLDQIDNATNHLNGERKDYYNNIISQLKDLRKQHNLKDGEEIMKDKLENKPVKVRVKFESNQEANDALKELCKKEQFVDCDLIFDDTIEVKTTDAYVDDLKKALRLYFVKKIEVKDSIKDDNYDNLEAYLKTVGADDRAYSIYKEASRTSLFGFKKFAQVNGGVYKKIDVEKAWNIVNGKVKDSEELVEDGFVELEKETKKLDSIKVLKLINITKKAKAIKDRKYPWDVKVGDIITHARLANGTRKYKVLKIEYEFPGRPEYVWARLLETPDLKYNDDPYAFRPVHAMVSGDLTIIDSVKDSKVKDSKINDVDPRILSVIEKLILEAIDLDKQRDKVIIQMKKTPDIFGVDENGKFIDKNKFVNNGMVKAIIKKYQDILSRWNRIMETNNFLKNELFRVRRIEEGLDAWYLQGLPNQTTLHNLNNLKKNYQDSCKDDMELSAKTSEELDNLMKQYQKKHPTWKFGEIRKDKGLYKCSVVKN